MKTVLISDNIDTFLGLRAVGIDGVVFNKPDDIVASFNKFAADSEVGIILLTDKVNNVCADFFKEYKLHNRKPLITVIPSRDSDGSAGGSLTDYLNDAVL